MNRFARRFGLVLPLAFAGCAANKLPVSPAQAYGPAAELKASDTDQQLLGTLREAMKASKVDAQLVLDPGLVNVARGIVNRSLEFKDEAAGSAAAPSVATVSPGAVVGAEASGGAAPRTKKHEYMRDNLFDSGIADANFNRKAITKGYNDGIPESAELADLFEGVHPAQGKLYVGVAAVADGLNSARHYAFVVAQRSVSLNALPRRAEPNGKLAVSGTYNEPATKPELWIHRPDGSVEGHPLVIGADGAFTTSIDLGAKTGQLVLEITDTVAGHQEERAEAAIGVGEQVAHWPPMIEDVQAKNAAELEKALDKALAAAHGGAYSGRQDVLDAARACAAAVASKSACSASIPGYSRIVAEEAVKLEDVELFTAELTALPSVKAIVGDKRVANLGIAAAPIKDKKGLYSVAVVFAGEDGPAAK